MPHREAPTTSPETLVRNKPFPEFIVGSPPTIPEPFGPPEHLPIIPPYDPEFVDLERKQQDEFFQTSLENANIPSENLPQFIVSHIDPHEKPNQILIDILGYFDSSYEFSNVEHFSESGPVAIADAINTRNYLLYLSLNKPQSFNRELFTQVVNRDIAGYLKFIHTEKSFPDGKNTAIGQQFKKISNDYFSILYKAGFLEQWQADELMDLAQVPFACFPPNRENLPDYIQKNYYPDRVWKNLKTIQTNPQEIFSTINRTRELVLENYETLPPHILQQFIRRESHGFYLFKHSVENGIISPDDEIDLYDINSFQGRSINFFKTLASRGLLSNDIQDFLTKRCGINHWEITSPQEDAVNYLLDNESDPIPIKEAIKTLRFQKNHKAAHRATVEVFKFTNRLFPGVKDQRVLYEKLDSLLNRLFPLTSIETNPLDQLSPHDKNLAREIIQLGKATALVMANSGPELSINSTVRLIAKRLIAQTMPDRDLRNIDPTDIAHYNHGAIPLAEIWTIFQTKGLSRRKFLAGMGTMILGVAAFNTIGTGTSLKALPEIGKMLKVAKDLSQELANSTDHLETIKRFAERFRPAITQNQIDEIIHRQTANTSITTFSPSEVKIAPYIPKPIKRELLGVEVGIIGINNEMLRGNIYSETKKDPIPNSIEVNNKRCNLDIFHVDGIHHDYVYKNPETHNYYTSTGELVDEERLIEITPNEIIQEKDGKTVNFFHQHPDLKGLSQEKNYYQERDGFKVKFDKEHTYYQDDPKQPGNYWVYGLEKDDHNANKMTLLAYVDTQNQITINNDHSFGAYAQEGGGYFWKGDNGAIYLEPKSIENGLGFPFKIIVYTPPRDKGVPVIAQREQQWLDGKPIYSVKPGSYAPIQQPLPSKEASILMAQISAALEKDPSGKSSELQKIMAEYEKKSMVSVDFSTVQMHYDHTGRAIGFGPRIRSDGSPAYLLKYIDGPIGATTTFVETLPTNIHFDKNSGLGGKIVNLTYPWPTGQSWKNQLPSSITIDDGTIFAPLETSTETYYVGVKNGSVQRAVRIVGRGEKLSISSLPLPQESPLLRQTQTNLNTLKQTGINLP